MPGEVNGTRRAVYAAVGAGVIALAAVGVFALNDPDVDGRTPQERIDQIARLADRKPLGAADAIARAAVEDPDATVRQAALVALGRFADPEHRPVVDAATKDPDPRARSGAAVTLGRYGDDRAADALGRLASEDPDQQVRLAAVTGLGRLDRPRAIAWLVKVMESKAAPAVRLEALRAVGRRFKVRFFNPPDPNNAAAWGRLVGKIRSSPAARKALKDLADSGGTQP